MNFLLTLEPTYEGSYYYPIYRQEKRGLSHLCEVTQSLAEQDLKGGLPSGARFQPCHCSWQQTPRV